MCAFRIDGVYLNVSDKRVEGYYTSGKDGKLVKHKYGILDKLYDVYRHGKTNEITYNYIYFQNNSVLHMGAISGELMNILSRFRHPHYWSFEKNIDFSIINNNKIKYYDSKKRECFLTSMSDGKIVIKEFTNFYDNRHETAEYQFNHFPAI